MDILPLAESFLADLSSKIGRPAAGISKDAREWLLEYPWPGDVRDLRNAIERAILLWRRRASRTRLRPILMTTAATVVGHFPLVIAAGPGAGARKSIGIMLVSGMIIGTVSTLFVVPSIYVLVARTRSRASALPELEIPEPEEVFVRGRRISATLLQEGTESGRESEKERSLPEIRLYRN